MVGSLLSIEMALEKQPVGSVKALDNDGRMFGMKARDSSCDLWMSCFILSVVIDFFFRDFRQF